MENIFIITKLEIRIILLYDWTELLSRIFSRFPCASPSHIPWLHFSSSHGVGNVLAQAACSMVRSRAKTKGWLANNKKTIPISVVVIIVGGHNWAHTDWRIGSKQNKLTHCFLFLWCQLLLFLVVSWLFLGRVYFSCTKKYGLPPEQPLSPY